MSFISSAPAIEQRAAPPRKAEALELRVLVARTLHEVVRRPQATTARAQPAGVIAGVIHTIVRDRMA
jgi:hypothetical protein